MSKRFKWHWAVITPYPPPPKSTIPSCPQGNKNGTGAEQNF